MPKLIVNPNTDQSWEIPLEPGVTVIGSDPASPYPIVHDSVAPAHCEVHVTDGAVSIHDLGSATGTFVNHAPVTESALAHGQEVSLGEVNLQFVSEARSASLQGAHPPVAIRIAPPLSRRSTVEADARPGPATPTETVVANCCRFHPKVAATWHCGTCNHFFCDVCVNARHVGDSVRHLCRKCGNDVAPVAIEYIEPVQENFFTALSGAFRYPCQGDGLFLVGAGAVCFTVVQGMLFIAQFVPLIGGFFALLVGALMTGYLVSFMKEIIYSTGQGRNTLPDWPDLGNWTDDILPPVGQFIALALLTIGPAFVVMRIHPFETAAANYGVAAGWLLVGALLAPMGWLGMTMFGSLGALNPVTIVLSIARVPGPCLTATLLFDLVIAAYFTLSYLAGLAHLPLLLTAAVLGFSELYAIAVAMRILGLLYRTEKDRLGWA